MNEAALARLAGVWLDVVVDVQVVHKVAYFIENGLALVVFADHDMVVAHRLWVDALDFVVLFVRMKPQNLKPFEVLSPGEQEISVAFGIILTRLGFG